VDYLRGNRHQTEYYALVLASAAGLMFLAGARDLIAIFVALELTSICQFILAGFLKDDRSSEAGIKYLLLGAVAAALTLYGMALLFGLSGSTSLEGIARAAAEGEDRRLGFVLASVLLAAGLGFKMAIVPSQMWVPDVYQGAPTPVTGYLSVGSKAAGFAVALRLFVEGLGDRAIAPDWAMMFAVLSVLSMTLGNVVALVQTDIKRLLGYSSIAQAGYFLIGLAAVAAGEPQVELGVGGLLFFAASYAFTNLGAFACVIAISHRIRSDAIADYSGMARRSPLLALALTLCLVSLTGIPPTAGFVAKLYIFNAAVQADLVWLAVAGVINSVISAYYYLRIVLNMYVGEPVSPEPVRPTPLLALTAGTAVVGLLALGIFPFPVIEAAEAAARVLS
jgi:NADH-quinone oxidoreductase subunit N